MMTRQCTTRWGVAFLMSSLLWCTGCVQRTISITSQPAGALVWVNDREVGRTPVDMPFLYYGDYDVRLEHEGYEPLTTVGKAKPPWWETVGVDLMAELAPIPLHSRVQWHYDLVSSEDDKEGLLERARAIRESATPVDG